MRDITNKNDKRVVKAGAGYLIGNYLLKGITFLSAPLFTRLLSTAEYGDFNTYLSYEAIFFIIVGLALHSSINSAKYKYGEKLDEYVSSLILFMMGSAFFWYILVNLFFPFYSKYLEIDRIEVNILVFHCFCSSLFQVYNAYASLSFSYKRYLCITGINGVSNILISWVLIVTLFQNEKSLGRIVGTVLPLGAIGIYIIVYFFKKSRPKSPFLYWKYGLEYSLPIVPHGISQVILNSFDRIMIKIMVGSSEAGIYSFAYTIYTLFKVATGSLENVWKPWVFERMNEKDYLSIRKRGSEYAFGVAVFTVLILLVSPELIKVLGDKDYWESTACVVPVVVGGYFAFLYSLPSAIEYFYEKTKFIAFGTVLAATLNIILNYFAIKKWGYIAAAYTTLITYFLYFVFHFIISKKVHGSLIFSIKALILATICLFFAAAVTLLLEPFWYIRWSLEMIAIGIAFILVEKRFGIIDVIRQKIKR